MEIFIEIIKDVGEFAVFALVIGYASLMIYTLFNFR